MVSAAEKQARDIQKYYNFQAKIYDLTRSTFLFGRKRIIEEIPFLSSDTFTFAEIGTGTGYNLSSAADLFPKAKFVGLDVSKDMIKRAKKKMDKTKVDFEILEQPFEAQTVNFPVKPDVILISYVLTMMNPQWKEVLLQTEKELAPGGYIAVTDFHDSRFSWFKNHMSNHHVRMDSHLLPFLKSNFNTKVAEVSNAYAGVWEYFIYLGRKKG